MEIGKDWTERPSKITNWSKDIDYVMFVDENGNSDIKDILKCISKNAKIVADIISYYRPHNYEPQ